MEKVLQDYVQEPIYIQIFSNTSQITKIEKVLHLGSHDIILLESLVEGSI